MSSYTVKINNEFLTIYSTRRHYEACYIGYVKHVIKIFKKNKIDTSYIEEILHSLYMQRIKFTLAERKDINAFHYALSTPRVQLHEQLRDRAIYDLKFIDNLKSEIDFIKKIVTVQERFEEDIKKIIFSTTDIEFEHKKRVGGHSNYIRFSKSEESIFKDFSDFLSNILLHYEKIISADLTINKIEKTYNKSNKYFLLYAEREGKGGFVNKDPYEGITNNFSEAFIIEEGFDLDYQIKFLSTFNFKNIQSIDFNIHLNLATISQMQGITDNSFIQQIISDKEKELLEEQLTHINTQRASKSFKV